MEAVSSVQSLVEAFFWIEATRPDVNTPYQSKVLWHSPENVAHVTKEHKEIPFYCFPDMNRIQIEKAQDVVPEYFTFSLTKSDGRRLFGFCFRHLFRGTARRFDVGRRTKHCLCIISFFPYYAFFKSLLMHIYGVALLERYPGQCKGYAQGLLKTVGDVLSNKINLATINEPGIFPANHPISQSASLIRLLPTVSWSVPKAGRTPYKDFLLLPLFDTLGVDKFFKVFSAVLCEKRVLFVTDDVNLLSTVIMSTVAMLHPFSWNHQIITVLPHKLVAQCASSNPYLIGLKRQSYGALRPEQLDGVLVVDLDNGEVISRGDCAVKDLVGDAGNALKQASEGLDRVRAGVASVFLGKTSDSNENAQKDIMPMLYLDLRSVLSNKPGSSSISSVASGLLRGVGGATKTVAESKAQWTLEAEKVLRDNLACFFVFLFADLDDFLSPSSSDAALKGSSQSVRTHDEIRSRFDLRGFLQKKRSSGASKLLVDFLMEFLHSQMFEEYCTLRLNTPATPRLSRSTSAASSTSTGSVDEDLFTAASIELMARQLPPTALHVKQAVIARSSSLPLSDSVDAAPSSTKIYTGQFHNGVLQYTQASSADIDFIFSLSTFDLDIQSLSNNTASNRNNRAAAQQALLERIVQDSYSAYLLRKIFGTIKFRLETCSAAHSKGTAGIAGCKALVVLYTILVQGQLSSLSSAIEMLPVLRAILKYGPKQPSSSLDFSSTSQFYDARPLSTLVLELLVDHKKLLVQRLHYMIGKGVEQRHRRVALPPRDLFTLNSDGSKRFPSFSELHNQFNDLKLKNTPTGNLKLTVPVKAVAEKEEGQDEGEESVTATSSRGYSQPSATSAQSQGKFAVSIKPTSSQSSLSSKAVSNSTLKGSSSDVNLLDLDGTLVDESVKYRALNKDTGEVLDLRKFEQPNAPLPFPYSTPTNASALKLKPPPNDSAAPRRKPAHATTGNISPNNNATATQSTKSNTSLDFSDFIPSFSTTTSAITATSATTSTPGNDFSGMSWGSSSVSNSSAATDNTFKPSTMTNNVWPGASPANPPVNPFLPSPHPAAAYGTPLAPPPVVSYAARPPQTKPKDPFASLVDFK